MREPEGGWFNRTFIGRHRERELVKRKLIQDGVLLLYGQPLVGKASLALQVAEELKDEFEERENQPFLIYTVDCKDACSWPDVMRAMCRAFSLDESAANENVLMGAILQQTRNVGCSKLLLLLLRLQRIKATGRDITSINRCLRALASSRNVLSLVTSHRQLRLPAVQRVSPMLMEDAAELLRHEAPGVIVEEFLDLLQRYCYGLPALVLQMAELISGDSTLAFTASELAQELADNPGLLMEGLDDEASQLFSSLTPEVQGHISSIVTLLDGSFSQEALQAVTGVDEGRVKTVLRHLYDEASIVIDNNSRHMCIEPLVLHHIRKLGHLYADDQARLRVVTLLGRVLTRAEHELYVEGHDTVYGYLHGDWPQLQHVLKQAIHCTGNTYSAYLQVALKADKLLAKCFPNEALMFYKNMADAAVRFGTPRDIAVMQGLVGMAVTFGTGTGWEEALGYFHRALPVLSHEKNSVSYLRLLCDLGMANFRLNRLHESEKYLQEAFIIGKKLDLEDADDRELIYHFLRARSLLALPSIFKGHLLESKVLLFETLELCEQYAPHHPDKPVMINSLGLIYERGNEDQDRALHYYERSLVERRRYQAVAPGDLVVTLNNVGMQYSRRGDHRKALTYLAEAEAIRARDNRWHYHTALTQQHMGQVALAMGDYKKAERHLLEASCVYSRCTPHHDVRGKVALSLAHIYVTLPLCDVSQTRKYLKEVCQMAEDKETELSDSGLVVLLSAIEHRVQIEGWKANSVTTRMLKWAEQLLDNFEGDPSKALAEHHRIIDDMINVINNDEVTASQIEAIASRIARECQMCGALAANENVAWLWHQIEGKGRELKSALRVLQSSPALENLQDKLSKGCNNFPTSEVKSDELTVTSPLRIGGVKAAAGSGKNQADYPACCIPPAPDSLQQQKTEAIQQQVRLLQAHQQQLGSPAQQPGPSQQQPAGDLQQHYINPSPQYCQRPLFGQAPPVPHLYTKGNEAGQFQAPVAAVQNPFSQNVANPGGLGRPAGGLIVSDQLKALAQKGSGRGGEGKPDICSHHQSQTALAHVWAGNGDAVVVKEQRSPDFIVRDQQDALRALDGDQQKHHSVSGTDLTCNHLYAGHTTQQHQQPSIFTDSNPPSLGSIDAGGHASTFCQRILYGKPTQETALDNFHEDIGKDVHSAVVVNRHKCDEPHPGQFSFVVHYPPHMEESASRPSQGVLQNTTRYCESDSVGQIRPIQKTLTRPDDGLDHPLDNTVSFFAYPPQSSDSMYSVNVFDVLRAHRGSSTTNPELLSQSRPSEQTLHQPQTSRYPQNAYTQVTQPGDEPKSPLHQLQPLTLPSSQSQPSALKPLSFEELSLTGRVGASENPVMISSLNSLSISQQNQTSVPLLSLSYMSSLSGPPALSVQGEQPSFPHTTMKTTSLAGEMTHVQTAAPVQTQGAHDVSRPSLTFDNMVTCAQQLMSVMRPEDQVTPEQRLALQQIASLSALTSSQGRGGGTDNQQLMKTLMLGDQMNKLAYFQQTEHQARAANPPSSQSPFSTHPTPSPPNQSEHADCPPSQSRGATQVCSSLAEGAFHAIHPPLSTPPRFDQWQHLSHLPDQPDDASPIRTDKSEPALPLMNPAIKGDQSLAYDKLASRMDEPESLVQVGSSSLSRSDSSTPAAAFQDAPAPFSALTGNRAVSRNREPTEDDDAALELPSFSTQELEFLMAGRTVNFAREAMENDERLDNPGHVCVSVNCMCSLNRL